MAVFVNAAVEGYTDEAVIRSLCHSVGLEVANVYGRKGKDFIDRQLAGYNNAARFSPWLVLRDLNRDADCAPQLVHCLLPKPAQHMMFRIVVRKVEAWLLADVESCARYLSVSQSVITADPESLDDPKAALIELARRSKSRTIREDMVPRPGSGATEGPAYASHLAEFARRHWSPVSAGGRSDSLARCLRRLQDLCRQP